MKNPFITNGKLDRKKAVYVAMAGVAFMLFVYILNPSLTGFAVSNSDLIKISNSVPCAETGKITLQFIYSDLCSHCKEEKPIITALEQKYAELLDVERINADDAVNAGLLKKYKIEAIPTMVFNCEYKVVGYRSFEQLENLILSLRK